MDNNVTIVTAFIANANQRQDRSIDDYIAYGKKLMAAPIKKIIFFDRSLIEKIPDDCFNDNTMIIPINKYDNYLYQYKEKITEFHLNTTCSEKDTLEYMMTICNKTEYIRNAIEINPFQSSQFVWVDFGINHVFKEQSDEEFISILTRLREKEFENVRIANIWDPSLYDMIFNNFKTDPYKDVMWFFAGGVLGGNSTSLIKFADLTKQQCIKVIEERKTIMWEVNIWFQVYSENKELFSLYSCDHNPSIITNY
jgi:Bacterial protein of unknown function (HtrL_YibB)